MRRGWEDRVRQAREAESQLKDFILDAKSYSAEIVQTALQEKQSVTQMDFESLIVALLRSVNTWVETDSNGVERRIQFHPPFTEERKDLIEGEESRRVCFDPRIFVDSEHVEYLGFGHPIIDALVKRVVEERHDGASAIRQISEDALEGLRQGWQFNWLLKVGGFRPREFVHPIFVDDFGQIDPVIGVGLLEYSRKFEREESEKVLDIVTLEMAYQRAHEEIVARRNELLVNLADETKSRYDLERERVERLFDNRDQAARDRIESCWTTLERLRASDQQMQRQAIPLWEANLERAQRELESLGQDRARSLRELEAASTPNAEYRLLAAARIEVVSQLEKKEGST